jgi:hypothetical protein
MSDIDTASAAFIAAATKMGLNAEQTAAGLAAVAQRMGATSSQLGKLAANIESAAAGSRAQGAASRQAGLELNKVISSARAAARSQEEFRDSANKAANAMIDSVSDPRLKASIRKYADAQMDAADRAETFRNVISMASKPIGAMGNIVGSTFSAYQGANSNIGTSAALLEGALKTAGSGVSGLGGILKNLGEGASFAALSGTRFGRIIGGIGIGVSLFGSLLSGTGSAMQTIAEKVLPKLQQEIEKQITAFMSLSSQGAVFANGLDEMTTIAGTARLTLTQLDSIVKMNKKTFAELGEGVAGGLTRVTNVIAAGGNDLRKGLIKLGYGVEEQAGLIADVIKDMRQTGAALPKDTQTTDRIVQETARYAENLRIISNITGEDAKKKMEEARSAATNLAFQQKLDGMSAEQKRSAIEAMALMSREEKQAFMEVVVNGQAMTQGSALLMSQNQGIANGINESAQALQAGTLSAREQARIQARNADLARQEALRNPTALAGLAGTGGPAQSVAEQQGRVLQDQLTRNTEATEAAIAAAERQAREGPGSRTEEMATAIMRNQDLNVQIQQSISRFGVLDTYLEAAAAATDVFTHGLEDLTNWMERQLSRPVPMPRGPVEPTEAELSRLNPQERDQRMAQHRADVARAQEDMQRANEENQRRASRLDRSAARDRYRQEYEAQQRRDLERRGAPVPGSQTPAGQPLPPAPAGNAAPAGSRANTGPRADINTAAGQQQAAAEYHRNGLVVQPISPNGTPLPPNPDANETQAQREARVAAETAARERIDEQDAQQSRQPNQRAAGLPQQETPTQRTLQRLATTMDSVNDAITQSLEKLASIESNTRRTATNTG